MATLLAVETSANLCSLAIHVAGRWFEDTQNVQRLHNQVVLSQLDALVERSGVRRRELDVIAFGAGPGSFTGVRIAASVAQGVAYAAGACVVPVSSSMALAQAYFAAPASEHDVLTVTRSRRDAFYIAGYRRPLADLPEPWLDDRLWQGDTAPDSLPEAAGTGDLPPWWPGHLSFAATVKVTARTVGEIALVRFAAGGSVAPAQALPIYVSGDSPWRPAGR